MCFSGRGTHITRDMYVPGRDMSFLGRRRHITRDMCFRGREMSVSGDDQGEHMFLQASGEFSS